MPCNSDYLAADGYEQSLSQVACLIDEINGLPRNRSYWRGYHPRVYCKADHALGDQLVSELCGLLRDRDVTRYSLEMQIWWRDHQEADKQRGENDADTTQPL